MKFTPGGIPFAGRRDSVDGPALGMEMSQEIAEAMDLSYLDLQNIIDLSEVLALRHDLDEGYQQWPVMPEIRGSGGGSVNLDDHFVFDRVRRLGLWILADLLIVFTSTPGGLSGDLEFRVPYEAVSFNSAVGYGFVRNPKEGENQDFVTAELWSDDNYVRLTSNATGGLYDADYFDFYVGTSGEIHLHLRYPAFDPWEL